MADVYEKNLEQKDGLTASDFVRIVGNDNVSYKNKLFEVGYRAPTGQLSALSDTNIDNMAVNNIYGTWWLNCSSTTITGTKPASRGQGILVCKKQANNTVRQVFVGVTLSALKSRYYTNDAWEEWQDFPIKTTLDNAVSDIDALQTSVNTLNTDVNALKGMTHQAITSNTDLNTLLDAGFYSCSAASIAQTLVNCPVTTNFTMAVYKKGSYQTQEILTGGVIYTRTRNSSGWAGWYKFTGTAV